MNHTKPDPTSPLETPPDFRTYGRKKGFLKPGAQARIDQLLPQHALPQTSSRAELLQSLGADPQQSRLWLEPGFGNGRFLAAMAARYPQDLFIGADLFLEGIAALLARLQREGLTNVHIQRENVILTLTERIPPHSLDRVAINFPDPWPKKRHHKRRLVQSPFLNLLATRMAPGAILTLATDWEHYAQSMMSTLTAHPQFQTRTPPTQFAPEPEEWVETRFQEKGRQAGRPTWHLVFVRT